VASIFRVEQEAKQEMSMKQVPPKLWLTFSRLHNVISQEVELCVHSSSCKVCNTFVSVNQHLYS
jgi:hypothetical protein